MMHEYGNNSCGCGSCAYDAGVDYGYRSGQIAALRGVVIGLSFSIEQYEDGEPSLLYRRAAQHALEIERIEAIATLASLGCPDARRIVGAE